MGYPRLDVAKQCELAPTLLTAMEGKPEPQQDRWGTSVDLIYESVMRNIKHAVTAGDKKRERDIGFTDYNE